MLGTAALFFCALLASPPEAKKEEEQEGPPPGPSQTVVVTAARQKQPLSETVSLVSVVSDEDLARSPSPVLDDTLRRIPGFSLFRRSSSLYSHPTAQGVSLRGIGPSGTSRSLVLFDELPWNDPFGGWIYWNRIPTSAMKSVEVVRGATSSLYGSSALGGTIQLIPRVPEPDTLELRGRFAHPQSYDLDLLAADDFGDWKYLVSGRLFDTEGFFIVQEELRGAVDRHASSNFQTFFGRAYYKNFHAGVNVFREGRGNGTQLQNNNSRLVLFETGYEGSSWEGSFYTQSGVFENTFSRILPDRSAEFITAEQEFRSLGSGAAFSWRPRSNLLVGTDWRRVKWSENSQNLAGVFVQQLLPLHHRVDFLAGLRFDWWQGQESQTSVNPRAGVLLRASDWLTLRTSAYRGFRVPTLNELHRPFRVGNVITEANPELQEEYLWGGEMGADFHSFAPVLLRLNVFWNSLRDAVSNATISVTPQLIFRQRQNLGQATVKGMEAEVTVPLGPLWNVWAGYLYSDAAVEDTGLRLPQVPRHQGSAGLEYAGPVKLAAYGRWAGQQFEDDRNQLELERYFLLGLSFSRPLSERVELFFAADNLLDREYSIGRTPIPRLGSPRILQGGVQFRLR